MIKILEDYYKIVVDSFVYYDNGIIFNLNGIKYYLVETVYDDEYLRMLADIIIELKNIIRLHEFVLNKDGRIKSDNYVLLKMNVLEDDITYEDIKRFSIPIDYKYYKYFVNMNDFWYMKIDYLEKQLTEISDNVLINNSFDYYVGIVEILLMYLSKYNISYDLYLSHKVYKSNSSIDFYNPLNITFDSKYRDIAYYIRESKDYDLLYNILDNINSMEYHYLFVRLCFPFEYFNALNSVLIDKNEESLMVKIVNNIPSYEQWLLKMQEIFGINVFYWIKKEVISQR